jgi:hypothetical protein
VVENSNFRREGLMGTRRVKNSLQGRDHVNQI